MQELRKIASEERVQRAFAHICMRLARRANGGRKGKRQGGGTRVRESNIGKTRGTRETRRSGSPWPPVRLIYNNRSILITGGFIPAGTRRVPTRLPGERRRRAESNPVS